MKPIPAAMSPVAILGAAPSSEKRLISLSGADESVSSFEALLRATPGGRRAAVAANAHAADNTPLSLTESSGELDLLGKVSQGIASSRSSPGEDSDDESGHGLVLPEGVAASALPFWPAHLGAAWGGTFHPPTSGAGTPDGLAQTGLAQAGPAQVGPAPIGLAQASLTAAALGTAHSSPEQSNLAGFGLASPAAGQTEIPAGLVLMDSAPETLPALSALPVMPGSTLSLSAADQTQSRAPAEVSARAFSPGMPISRAAMSSAADPKPGLPALPGSSEAAGPRLSVEPRPLDSAGVVLAQHPGEHVNTWASQNLQVAKLRLQEPSANPVSVRLDTSLVQTGPAQMGLAQAGFGHASPAAGQTEIPAGLVQMYSARETLPALPALPVMSGSPLSLSAADQTQSLTPAEVSARAFSPGMPISRAAMSSAADPKPGLPALPGSSEAAGPRLSVLPRSLDSTGVVLAQHPGEHVDTWASQNLKISELRLQEPGANPVPFRLDTSLVQTGPAQMGLAQAGFGHASPAAGQTEIPAGLVRMDSARETLPALPALPVMPGSTLSLSAADQTQSRAPAEVSARAFSPGMPISRAASSSFDPLQPQPLATPFATAMSSVAAPKPGLPALSGSSEAAGPRLSVEPRSLDSAGVELAQFGAVSVVAKPDEIEQNAAPNALTEIQNIADARAAWVPELGGMVSPSEKFTGLVDFAQHLAEHVDTWVSQNLQVAEFRLQEPSANPVLVRIEMNGQQASVMFRTDVPACREALSTQIDQLSDLLSAQGLQLAGASVAGSGADSQPGREARPGPVWVEPADSRSAPETSGLAQSHPRRGPALAGRTLDVFV